MANRSRTVITESNSKHKSRMLTALKKMSSLNDKAIIPSGVWGSTATVKSGDVTIKSEELDLEFDVPFDDDLESNEGEIIVYNLTDSTINHLKANAGITIRAGYTNDTGLIFDGYITKVRSYHDGADKITKIKIIDDIKKKENINITFSSGSKASYILKELLKKTNAVIAVFETVSDYTYENDETVNEPLETAIKKYSEVCGVSVFKRNGSLYCCRLKKASPNYKLIVEEDTGLIGSPSPFEEIVQTEGEDQTIKGYEFDMIFQHRACAGVPVTLKSKSEGTKSLYIKSGVHRFNESECTTSIKAVLA